jgi:hypothetical protein
MTMDTTALLEPAKLWTRSEVLSRPCPVPNAAGVYAWYFRTCPDVVPTEGCVRSGDLTLLYVGISPKAPPSAGTPSRQTLRTRLRYHFRGSAEGSTLRLTLGCLLGIELRRVGSGLRMTFAAGEQTLNEWLDRNARVAWLTCDWPWRVEEELIRSVSLPLNLDQNRNHTFHAELSATRRAAKARARDLPVV